MFTGIIQGLGRVEGKTPLASEYKLDLAPEFDWGEPLALGESIAVSGVCLTVTEIRGNRFSAFVSAETLSRSILGRLGLGEAVNLERALRLSDRLGGHLVAGHVDGLGVIRDIRRRDNSIVYTIGLDRKWAGYLIEKGSVAVDGISLTVNQVFSDAFTVNIIPHTAAETTLRLRKTGDPVNLETDLIGKYVARFLGREPGGSKIDEKFLAEHGFI